jgi:hypothetical protein
VKTNNDNNNNFFLNVGAILINEEAILKWGRF